MKVEVNGQAIELISATYHLPQTVAGVQVDCPITRGYMTNTNLDHWGLTKAARLRVWPAGSPWIEPGTFVYPARQRWFASATQMANEPTFVDGIEQPSQRKIYYHSGLDIGGAEGTGRCDRRDRRTGRLRRNDDAAGLSRTAPSIRVTTSSTCSTIEAGTTDTAISSRSTRRSSRGRRSRWARRLDYLARKGAAAAGRTSTSRSSAGSHRAVGGRRRATRSSGKPTSPASAGGASPSPDRTTWSTSARSFDARWGTLLEPIGQDRYGMTGLSPTDLPPRGRGSSESTTSPGNTARSSRSPTTAGMSPTTSPSCRCSTAPTPTRSRPSTRRIHRPEHPPGRRDHLQGSHLFHHRRARDLGLRRRHPAVSAIRRQRQETGPRRLRLHSPSLQSPGDYLVHVERSDRKGRKATAQLHVHIDSVN